MAGAVKIKAGTKLNLAFDVGVGQQPVFNMICTYAKKVDEACFLVSIPMKEGKPMEVDETQKFLIRQGSGADAQIMAGYVDDVVRDGIRRYWKIRTVTEQRQFFERKDERVKAALPVTYMQDTWPVNFDGVIDPEEALTLDVSAGGAALYLNRHFEVGETCFVTLPDLGTTEAGKAPSELVSAICWQREAPKGSPFRLICGVQFRFADALERKQMENYVAYVKQRYKL